MRKMYLLKWRIHSPMSHKVIILESAEYDLKGLKDYIVKNFSFKIWQHSYDKLKKAIRNLKTFPYAGAIPESTSGVKPYKLRSPFSLNVSLERQM